MARYSMVKHGMIPHPHNITLPRAINCGYYYVYVYVQFMCTNANGYDALNYILNGRPLATIGLSVTPHPQ